MVLHEGKIITVNIGSIKQIQIKDVLGGGGFANVFKVEDTATSKLYVLKHIQLKPKLEPSEKEILIQRIKNEGSVVIPSEYIVPPIGLSEFEKDNYAILFDFIPNTIDFGDWILENKSVNWEKKQALFLKVLKGIHDAHSMNVIHRDLKPQNILITTDNEPRIIDFGLAKFKDTSITMTGDISGSFPYIDPFVLLKGIKYVDARCDVFALGVMLHQLQSGIHYWIVNDNMEFPDFVKLIVAGECKNILDIEKVNLEFTGSDQIKNIISQATVFDPEKRLRTINEMIKLWGEEPIEKEYPTIDFSLTSPVLVIEDGSAKGAMNLITIDDGGTRELNRQNLDATNKTISRKKHAIIEREGNKHYIYDGGSTNGTFLNGSRLKVGRENRVEIRHTDRIRFADLWTRFVFLKK